LGNSVFLNEEFVPYPDQWEFLSSIRKMSRHELEERLRDAEVKGQLLGVRLPPESEEDDELPWKTTPSRSCTNASIVGPLPASLELILANQIYVRKDALPPSLRNRLIRLAAFPNPEFYKLQAMRLSTYDKPRIIGCAEDHPKHIGLPRGCLDEVLQTLLDSKIKAVVRGCRQTSRSSSGCHPAGFVSLKHAGPRCQEARNHAGQCFKARKTQRSLVSTLRKAVKAMGGDARIVAEFPDCAPVVLSELSEDEPSRKSRRKP
jgi:hypothetical protein